MAKPLIHSNAENSADGDLSVGVDPDVLRIIADAVNDQAVIGIGTGLDEHIVVTTRANDAKDHGHGPHTDPTLYIHSASDVDADDTEWVALTHDQARALLTTGKGELRIMPFSGLVRMRGAGNSWLVLDSTLDGARVGISFSDQINSVHMILISDTSPAQVVFGLADVAGNALIVTNYGNYIKDHDHGVQTDPTLYVHSDTDPDVDNTQWGSLHHDQTDFNVSAGKGDIRLQGLAQVVVEAGLRFKRVSKGNGDTPYAVTATDHIIGVQTSTGVLEIDLPAAATAGVGRMLIIKDEDGAAGATNITIDPNGAEQIDGGGAGTPLVINANYGSATLYCDGSNWFSI